MHTPLTQMPGTLRPFLRLVWPVMIEQFLAMLIALSDTVLAGRYLQQEHIAAMTVVGYGLWVLQTIFTLVSLGALAMTARFVGAGERESANRVAHQAYLAGVGLALVVTAVGLSLGPRLLVPMQMEPEAQALAWQFFQVVLPLAPMMMLETVGIAILRGAGDMVVGLVTMIAVNVVNIAVCWSLLLGLGPLPQLGWQGLAIGAACGHFLGGLLPTLVLARGRRGLKLRRELFRPDPEMIRRILRIGVPGGTDLLMIGTCQLAYLSIINRLGTLATAAHGVAIRIESLAYMPGNAFQVAAATMAGQYLGARNVRQATRSVLVALAAGLVILSAGAVWLFLLAEWLVGLFLEGSKPEVIATAAPLLRIVSFGLPPLAVLMVLSGALRGAGDTRWPLAITVVGLVGVRLPASWILAHSWGWGVRGAWYAMVADLAVRCLLIAVRFGQGGWKRIEV